MPNILFRERVNSIEWTLKSLNRAQVFFKSAIKIFNVIAVTYIWTSADLFRVYISVYIWIIKNKCIIKRIYAAIFGAFLCALFYNFKCIISRALVVANRKLILHYAFNVRMNETFIFDTNYYHIIQTYTILIILFVWIREVGLLTFLFYIVYVFILLTPCHLK